MRQDQIGIFNATSAVFRSSALERLLHGKRQAQLTPRCRLNNMLDTNAIADRACHVETTKGTSLNQRVRNFFNWRLLRNALAGAAGLALLFSWPAIATGQSISITDQTFVPSDWTIEQFSNVQGNSVTAVQQLNYGKPKPSREVEDSVEPKPSNISVDSSVYGVHYYVNSNSSYPNAVYPITAGIASITFKMDYDSEFPWSISTGDGQAFGPALKQGSKYYITDTHPGSAITTQWMAATFKFNQPLLNTDFYEITHAITSSGDIYVDRNSHPDFSGSGAQIYCGFFTGNSTPNGPPNGGYSLVARYDNYSCAYPAGILKVCKVAGPFVVPGAQFHFNYSTSGGIAGTITVPAGNAPGGNCALVPDSLPVNAEVTVTEQIPAGGSVTNIAVAPISRLVSADPPTGKVVVKIGSGVTEATFTDKGATGYLEICKKSAPSHWGDMAGANFPFTISPDPGNVGSIVVPVSACSPTFQVAAGQVKITETLLPDSALKACATIPGSQQIACDTSNHTSTVTVQPGDISTQTIAIFTNIATEPSLKRP